jgi:hypothetical protein
MPCNPVTLCRDLRNFIVDALLMQLASRCTMAREEFVGHVV